MRIGPVFFTAAVAVLLSAFGMHPHVLVLYCVPCLIMGQIVLCRARGSARNRLGRVTALNLCLHLSVLMTSWPLRLAYIVSEPALQQLAHEAIDEPTHYIPYPRQAGLFRIQRVNTVRYAGTACFRLAFVPAELQVGVDGRFPPRAPEELMLRHEQCRLMPGDWLDGMESD